MLSDASSPVIPLSFSLFLFLFLTIFFPLLYSETLLRHPSPTFSLTLSLPLFLALSLSLLFLSLFLFLFPGVGSAAISAPGRLEVEDIVARAGDSAPTQEPAVRLDFLFLENFFYFLFIFIFFSYIIYFFNINFNFNFNLYCAALYQYN